MTRDDFSRILRQMEHCRELSMESETTRERSKLNAEYLKLWRSVEPYAKGRKKFTESVQVEPLP